MGLKFENKWRHFLPFIQGSTNCIGLNNPACWG